MEMASRRLVTIEVVPTIRRGGRVERAVFVGIYCDGGRLERDAIRSQSRALIH
jgi:hypothetical protein